MITEPIDWTNPPSRGWTYEQAQKFDLPFEWDLVDGVLVIRGRTNFWHDQVRDALSRALHGARSAPYAVNAERCVLVDDYNPAKPDVVVYDKTGLDVFELECLPSESVVLAIEVVSPGSRSDDRFGRPGMYAEAGIPYFWRVERGEDSLPVVHEFHRDGEKGVYLPVAEHTGLLRTALPYPVEIDLKQVVEL